MHAHRWSLFEAFEDERVLDLEWGGVPHIVRPAEDAVERYGTLSYTDLMDIIGERLQRMQLQEKESDGDEARRQQDRLQASVLDDVVQYCNRFLFSVINTKFIGIEQWESNDRVLTYHTASSLFWAFAELKPFLRHWLQSPRRRQYYTVDDDRRLRTQEAQAWLLEGPVPISPLCDIVGAFGQEI